MMKITRQNINESYSTTVDWLNDFSRSMEKNADFLSNVKTIFRERKNKFSSIDEKMHDIKQRAGFDLVTSELEDPDITTKSAMDNKASGGSCGCTDTHCSAKEQNGAACSSCSKAKDVKSIENILSWIVQFIEKNPGEPAIVVLHNCRNDPHLGFRELEGRIDHRKLKDFISNTLGSHELPSGPVEYTKPDLGEHSEGADIPDFMSHSIPSV